MNRIPQVVQLQLVVKQTFVWNPLVVLGGAFVLSLIVFALIPTDDVKISGAAQAPLWYLVVIGVLALTRTFPFSQALSVTRREYHLGTLLTAALTSAALATLLVLGGLVERATDGWGLNGFLFAFPAFWSDGPVGAWLAYLVAGLLCFTAGYWSAALYKRYGPLGLTLIGLGLAGALALALVAITRADGWAWVGEQVVAAGTIGVTGWAAVLLAAMVALSYLTLRRTLP